MTSQKKELRGLLTFQGFLSSDIGFRPENLGITTIIPEKMKDYNSVPPGIYPPNDFIGFYELSVPIQEKLLTFLEKHRIGPQIVSFIKDYEVQAPVRFMQSFQSLLLDEKNNQDVSSAEEK